MKKIVILELGGTISSFSPDCTSEFYNHQGVSNAILINGLFQTSELEIICEFFCNKISHELSLVDLLSLGNKIQDQVDDPDVFGVVISMGTNAMEDVAYFIGLVVNTSKNIVFTGSHFPQNSLMFDGKKNLYNAIVVASTQFSQSLGVVITLNDTVVSARWATKSKPGLPNDFSAGGSGIIGYIVGEVFHLHMIPKYKHTHESEFSIRSIHSLPKIFILYAHLGLEAEILDCIINQSSIDGIVSAGYGKGYQTKEVSKVLYKATKKGIPVVRCARAGQSMTNIDVDYDCKYNFILAADLIPHKASILLAVCLSKMLTEQEISTVFQKY
ncbi:MAG: asparaginase [Legionella sp.]|nr:asparaginase [Legionella sp.]